MLDSMIHRGSYMSAHVLLIFLNELRKKRDSLAFCLFFRIELNKFNNTVAQMSESIYHTTYLSHLNYLKFFGMKTLRFC